MATKVTLRKKKIKGDKFSLYLDYYPAIKNKKNGKSTRREFLKMYPYKTPIGKEQKNFNVELYRTAETIMHKRTLELAKPDIYNEMEQGRINKKIQGESSFLDFFRQEARKKKSGSTSDNWSSAYSQLEEFCDGNLKFNQLNKEFCENFRSLLLKANSKKYKANKVQTISQNTASCYFNKFKSVLKLAYTFDKIEENLNDKVEFIKQREVIKNTLTLPELINLANTICPNEITRKISLFTAITGIPFAEIKAMTWGNIIENSDEDIRIIMTRVKTSKNLYVNISQEALKYCGTKKEPQELVFPDIENKHRYKYFQQWLRAANIKKKFTYHDLRHTYGTLQIDLGTDIYTLQNQLGQNSPRQAMHYGKASDKLKQNSSSKISLK